MLSEGEVRNLVDEIFEREALALGGLFANREIDEGVVGRLLRTLDATRTWTLRQLGGGEGIESDAGPNLTPHPGIEEFLGKLGCSRCGK